MTYEEMPIKELKEDFLSSFASVYIYECYGTSDLRRLEGAGRELERRGYRIDNTPQLPKIIKEEE